MELEGRVWKSRKKGDPSWLVEVSALDIVTQGHSREEALEMIQDAILELMRSAYRSARKKSFDIMVHDYEKDGLISISCSDPKLLAAFSIKRQRLKTRTTLREAARILEQPGSYHQRLELEDDCRGKSKSSWGLVKLMSHRVKS